MQKLFQKRNKIQTKECDSKVHRKGKFLIRNGKKL